MEEEFESSGDRLALKLKLMPTKEQMKILDEAFFKWADICNRLSIKNEKLENLEPDESKNSLQFSKTQLNSALIDVKDLRNALNQNSIKISMQLERIKNRKKELEECISDPSKREASPDDPKLFRPLAWSKRGFLSPKYHTIKHYQAQIRRLATQEKRISDTLAKIQRGRIRFKPKRITLWPSSIKISFGSQSIILKPFSDKRTIKISVVTSPLQPIEGSSKKSKEYMETGIKNLLAYSINQLLFGLNRSQKMLAQSKKEEKMEKFVLQMKKKKEGFKTKIAKLESDSLLGRQLTEDELKTIDSVAEEFFRSAKVRFSKDYLSLLKNLANELYLKKEYLDLNKYPILIRKPLSSKKHKRLKNLKPEEWKYYIQFGYEPILRRKNLRNEQNIIGIDRGVSSLLAVSVFSPQEKRFIFNKLFPNPIAGWRWKIRKLRRSIQHLERRIRAQTNEHIFENQMKKKLRSIEQKVELHLHELSADIVKLAEKYNACIVLESLENLKQHGRKRSKWTKDLNYTLSLFDYGRIAQLIAYKSELNGIKVYKIDPANTSKTCSSCMLKGQANALDYNRGIKDKNGNTNMKIGRCSVCAKNEHSFIDADLNAARVIALCKYFNVNAPRPYTSRKEFNFKPTEE